MEINTNAEIVNHEIFESVIRTTERMTYDDVYEILDNRNEELRQEFRQLVPMFEEMEHMAAVLRNKCIERTAIDFDIKESKVIVDEKGHPTDGVIRDRQVSERLIEEFMLAANETIAEHFYWLDVPIVHRNHENPDEEKLEHFIEFLAGIGYQIKG